MCTAETLGYINATETVTNTNQTVRTAADNHCKEKVYYIKQKLLGVMLIVLGAASIPISEGDGTAFVMTLFIGLALIGTKDKVLMEKEDN